MKRVTFKVAKVIKKSGYPQGITKHGYWIKNSTEGEMVKYGDIVNSIMRGKDDNIVDIPTYMEVWLWLWREKKIAIDINYSLMNGKYYNEAYMYDDPEQLIIDSIDYMVDNNLIK